MTATSAAPAAGPSAALDEAVRSILYSDDVDLPVLPEVAAKLLQLTNDIDCEPRDLVDLIRRDQSLAGHLLRIANSTRYSGGQTVSSIQQALARLGLLRVREIVVLIHCQTRVFDVAGFEDVVRHSFRHSLATAAFAQEIARVRRLNVEEAFMSGLLHDVGRPVLLQELSDRRRDKQFTADDDTLLQAAEEHRIPLAARLIREWDLPARLSEAVLHQNSPMESETCGENSRIVNLAIQLSLHTLEGTLAADTDVLQHPMIAVLNLYPEQIAGICEKAHEILDWVESAA
ncbi:MAG: HDOD domain-containing protein [Planctomycetaceae bacterium]